MARRETVEEGMDTGTAVVTVALKHPNGVILEVFREETSHEPVMGGGTREVKVFRKTGKQYPLFGNSWPFGETPPCQIIGGYALTPNIPKSVWETWRAQHSDSPLVENGLILAHESMEWVRDGAKDGTSLKSGLEPIKPSDERLPRRRSLATGKMVTAVEAATQE